MSENTTAKAVHYVKPPLAARRAARDLLLLSTGALLSTAVALANENTLSYEIEAAYEFNDNVRLLPDDQEIDISGGSLALPVSFQTRTERFTGTIDARLESSRFNESEYDSDDQRLEGRMVFERERGESSLYALINRDTTRDSEFLDTGIVGLSATRREAYEAGGAWDHLFTERVGVLAQIDYADVSFDAERFNDYQYGTADIGLTLQGSERFRYQLQAHGTRLEADGLRGGTESDGVGVKAGFRAELSEQSYLEVLGGWLTVDTEYEPGSSFELTADSTDSYLLDARYRFKGERYDVTAQWISAPLPSANGFLQVTDQFTLRYRYSLAERSRLTLSFVGGRRGVIDDRVNVDRDYYRLGLRFEQQLSQSWFIAGRYIYSQQDREQVPGTAEANQVHLSLVFRPRESVW